MVEAKGYSPVFFEESFGEYIVGIETARGTGLLCQDGV